MTLQEIQALMDRFERSSIQSMKLTMADFSLELNRGGAVLAASAAVTSAPPLAAPTTDSSAPKMQGEILRAPLLGTFYAASAPDAPAYVSVGDQVVAGQTVCLIEAMKMMSEVSVPCDCVIEEIYAESGALLEYDAPILRYRKV